MSRLFTIVAVLAFPLVAQADPLQCVPKEANVVLKVESPRRLVESAVRLDAWKSLQAFPQVKETLDSANVRRLFQLLAYVENETKLKWPELIDAVAGDGMVIAFKAGMDPAPTVLVTEGRDDTVVEKVFGLLLAGIKDEATRDSNIKLKESKHGKVPVYTLGDDFHFARLENRVIASNKLEALKRSVELANPRTRQDSVLKNPTLPKAKALAGKDAAAWFWFDLATAKETKQGKDFFENTRKDPFQLLIFGGTVDAARRSDFVSAGLTVTPQGYNLTVRMPAKKTELHPLMRIHVPEGSIGSKPLLEPPGVVLSQSMYLDVGHFWKNRKEIFGDPMQLKDIEKGTNDLSKLLPGTNFGELLEKSGPYHRFVMIHTGEKLYKREPGNIIPPTAYVMSLRDESLGESLEGILRAGGLLAGFQTGWKSSESTVDDVKIVSYKFPEAGETKFPDDDNLRFNAMPSFAIVGDSFVVASTPGAIKALIPVLKKESKSAGSSEVWKARVFAQGASDVLTAYPDATVTDAVLSQGLSLAEARQQALALAKWLRTLGTATLSIDHGDEFFSFNATWNYGSKQ